MAEDKTHLGDLLFNTPVVEFIVGRERKSVFIHKQLLMNKTEFFRKMFHSKFREAQSGEIKIPTMPTQVMRLICQWLYSGKISPIIDQDDMARTLSTQSDELDFLAVESVYHLGISFAEEWLCEPLARQLFVRIREYHCKPKTPINHGLLFDILPKLQETSTFRLWLIDLTWAHIQFDQGAFHEFCDDLARMHQRARAACSSTCKQLSKLQSQTEEVCSSINKQLTVLKAASDDVDRQTGVMALESGSSFNKAYNELINLQHATEIACIDLDDQLAMLRTPEAGVLQEFVKAMFRVHRSKKSSFEEIFSRELYVTAAPSKSS